MHALRNRPHPVPRYRAGPVAAFLASGTDDEPTRPRLDIVAGIFRRDPRADDHGLFWSGLRDRGHLLGIGWVSGGGAGHDEGIGQEKFGRGRRLSETDIGRQGVGAVFFLDVHPQGDPLRADPAAEPQQFSGATLVKAFVPDVGKDESLDPDEIKPGRVSGSEGLLVRPGEDLEPGGQA